MARLTQAERDNLPSSQFALQQERKYPIPDRIHAINAKARATQQYKQGHLTKAQKEEIDRKANAVIKNKK